MRNRIKIIPIPGTNTYSITEYSCNDQGRKCPISVEAVVETLVGYHVQKLILNNLKDSEGRYNAALDDRVNGTEVKKEKSIGEKADEADEKAMEFLVERSEQLGVVYTACSTWVEVENLIKEKECTQ